MTVDALKQAIVELPEEQRHALSAWLSELDYDSWDRQMAEDFSDGGRGAHLVERIKADIAAGIFRPVQELCAERERKNK